MEISASLVKQLREKTGAGMMDCKKALTEAEGDFDKAIELLRKRGAAVAAKRAERTANEGSVVTRSFNNKKSAAMIEVKCETDFVANSDDFIQFSGFVADALVNSFADNLDALLNTEFEGKLVNAELEAITGRIGEKIEIGRFVIENSPSGTVVNYVHHGSKLGVLVKASDTGEITDELEAMLRDIAMQVAAMSPIAVYREEVDKSVIERELDIYKEVARKEGKPEQILEKIAVGKMNKFYQENCLFEQAFVKDNTKTIGDLIKEYNKKNNTQAKIDLFRRFHLSDGAE